MLTSTRPAPAPPCLPHLCLEPLDALMHAHAQRRRLCALCDVVGARRAAGGRRRSRGPGRSCSCGRRGGGVCGRRRARAEAQPICPMEVAPPGLLPRHVLLVCGCGCGPPWVRPGRAKTVPSTRRLRRTLQRELSMRCVRSRPRAPTGCPPCAPNTEPSLGREAA